MLKTHKPFVKTTINCMAETRVTEAQANPEIIRYIAGNPLQLAL